MRAQFLEYIFLFLLVPNSEFFRKPNQELLYGTAKKKRPGYLVGNLVPTNWPIEKALHAIGYNQIPTK